MTQALSEARLLVAPETVGHAIDRAARHLVSLQAPQGYWCAELEANIGLDAQWILCRRWLGIDDPAREARLLARIRLAQRPDGGFCLYDGAPSDISITIEAYFAGKLAGVSPDEPWMARAREFIRSAGGPEQASVICKIYLALFDEYRWKRIPALPVTLMFVPRGTPFNIYEMSYWARTCVVPLLVLYHRKRRVKPPPGRGIEELYVPEGARGAAGAAELCISGRNRSFGARRPDEPALSWRSFFRRVDAVLKLAGKVPIGFHRERACGLAERWILDHQDEDGGWGGIFPAMTHSVMALHALGYPVESGAVRKGLDAIEALEIRDDPVGTTRVQPCVSPVWDTAWAVLGLVAAGIRPEHRVIRAATDWLVSEQILTPGDWSVKAPGVPPGGWAFQFHNAHYPDTDDSSAVLMALLEGGRDEPPVRQAFQRGLEWLLGLQNEDGGWGAFEREVNRTIWNEIPFNDAQNMLDPSTADVSGRCVEVLSRVGYPREHPSARAGIRYLLRAQEPDGKWWGRWGVNYVYGTWSALAALGAARDPAAQHAIGRGADWLERVQNADGGWGESCKSYEGGAPGRGPASTASQTAWAILGLTAAGRAGAEACRRGVRWLLEHQEESGGFAEEAFTGTGFPGVFYLRYHYYRLYFPLLALARWRQAAGA